MIRLCIAIVVIFGFQKLICQDLQNNPGSNHGNKFEQLGTILPSPNEYRTASGAPGNKYWQQRVDYDITCSIDEKNTRLNGKEKITYFNNSPDKLDFLWFQLDENAQSNINNANYQSSNTAPSRISYDWYERLEDNKKDNGFGDKIISIKDQQGNDLKYIVNKTMMRVELSKSLMPGEQTLVNIEWYYNIPDRMKRGGRGGYEYFPDEKNYIFTMSQWYPRLCVYSDFQGWQNHQFSGRAEFALTFGNFKVAMTVPADHIVCSTGECQNYNEVLSADQLKRWQKAQTTKEPIEIVTLAEAAANEKDNTSKTKTWVFKAENVRDFAWGASPKFVWDAMPVNIDTRKVMAMSFYGKEAYPIYRKFSTKVVAHTIQTYSDFSIPYPYPVAQSVEASNGMEYPMICFNFGRAETDGTYSEGLKNGVIGVIIHEVGHNFFPMIINSDERQWTWMDEGLNSFVEYLTEELWDNKFPVKKGPAYTIVDYMKLPKNDLEPIMTNSDNIVRFGPNAYSKPAVGLNILRETIMGRELFDYAFKEYCKRWAFKHPTPADFFRTMEDASGEDLDWFWRGWFYGTDPVDLSLDSVKLFKGDYSGPLAEDRKYSRKVDKPGANEFDDISKQRNRADKNISFYTDRDTTTRDFYWRYNMGLEKYDTTSFQVIDYANQEPLDKSEQKNIDNRYFYEVHVSNKGGLVMPIILKWNYSDGSSETEYIPAQIWRHNEKKATKFFMKEKSVESVILDPMRETADINESNNYWGDIAPASKFKVFKQKKDGKKDENKNINPMNSKRKV